MKHSVARILYVLPLLIIQGCSTVVGPLPGDVPPALPNQPVIPVGNAGSNYHPGTAMVLFGDVRARHIGDTLTVVLSEKTSATKSANTALNKASDFDSGSPTFAGKTPTLGGDNIGENSWGSEQTFDGTGSSSQSNSLSGDITVTIHEVYPNGNMLVQGEKWLQLNRGSEYVRVSGIVRPYDISTANTVLSSQIADARITYSGKGDLANANKPGVISRMFNKFWPL